MNLRIDPGEKIHPLCGQLSAFIFVFLYFGHLKLSTRVRCFRLHRLLVQLSLVVGIVNNKRRMYRIQILYLDFSADIT